MDGGDAFVGVVCCCCCGGCEEAMKEELRVEFGVVGTGGDNVDDDDKLLLETEGALGLILLFQLL